MFFYVILSETKDPGQYRAVGFADTFFIYWFATSPRPARGNAPVGLGSSQ